MQILQYSEGRWIVEGSKGKEYHVKRWLEARPRDCIGWVWACDCPGSIYRGHCRHINAVKLKLLQDLSNDAIKAIRVAESKYTIKLIRDVESKLRIATSEGKS